MAEALDQVREALLGYYKDQLVSHATILLTLGLLCFAALGALKEAAWSFLQSPMLSAVTTVGIWQLFRFAYYGRLAGCIMYAKPEDRATMEKDWKAQGKDQYAELTDMYLLQAGTEKVLREKTGKAAQVIDFFAHPMKRDIFLVYVAIFAVFLFVWQALVSSIATT